MNETIDPGSADHDVESRQESLTTNVVPLSVDLIGLGMHGSWVGLSLVKMGVKTLRVWDTDIVVPGNIDNQIYGKMHIGDQKTLAFRNVCEDLTSRAALQTELILEEGWQLEGAPPAHDIVISCADSMEIRADAARWARDYESKLFMESRSARQDISVFAFTPSWAAVGNYTNYHFPETIESTTCAETGIAAVGMQVAALMSGILILTKGGQIPLPMMARHQVSLGMMHEATPLSDHLSEETTE